MQSYDLESTLDNIKEAIENDTVGRNQSLNSFLKLLRYGDLNSLAIDAAWGSGKTFFIKQAKYIIDVCASNNQEKIKDLIKKISSEKTKTIDFTFTAYRTVYFDAWKNDSEPEPIVSLLKSFIETDWKNSVKESLKKALAIANSIIKQTTSVDINEITSWLEKDVSSQEELENQFKKVLENLIPETGKLIIFIDELDRCRPSYAVKLLERIKHYFSNDRIVFVFSTDISSLQNIIKRFYGTGFNGYEYLDRFFEMIIQLPEADIDKYFTIYDKKGIMEINKILGVSAKSSFYWSTCVELIRSCNMSLRQINHFIMKTNSAVYEIISRIKADVSPFNYINSLLGYILIPFLIACQIEDIKKYREMIEGKGSHEFICKLGSLESYQTYCKRFNLEADDVVKKLYDLFSKTDIQESIVLGNRLVVENPIFIKKQVIASCSLMSEWNKIEK